MLDVLEIGSKKYLQNLQKQMKNHHKSLFLKKNHPKKLNKYKTRDLLNNQKKLLHNQAQSQVLTYLARLNHPLKNFTKGKMNKWSLAMD